MSQQTNNRRPPGGAVRLFERRWVTRPQPEAFEYTADFSNIEDWDPGVVASRKVTEGPIGLGTRFELEVKFGAGTIPMIYEITVYQPDHRVVLVGDGEKLHAVDEITFASQDNMTVIDYTADLTFRNLFRFIRPLMGPVLRRVGKDAVDGLVRALDR
jgi:dehydrogenase/reductase SDR family protein 12